MSLQLDATERVFVVEYRERAIKQVPLKHLIGERLPLEAYLELITTQARTQLVAGRPVGQQLRLPV